MTLKASDLPHEVMAHTCQVPDPSGFRRSRSKISTVKIYSKNSAVGFSQIVWRTKNVAQDMV